MPAKTCSRRRRYSESTHSAGRRGTTGAGLRSEIIRGCKAAPRRDGKRARGAENRGQDQGHRYSPPRSTFALRRSTFQSSSFTLHPTMSRNLNRREFVQATTWAGVAAATAGSRSAFAQAPAVGKPKTAKAVVIALGNGNKHKNGGRETCVEKAFAMMTSGADLLDALVAGVTIVELDP